MKKIQNKNVNIARSFKNYILLGICALLAVASILMTIETATSGAEVSSLEKAEAGLASQKRDLEENLVKTLSMGELQVKSSELGFKKPENLVYVSQVEPVAKLP